MKRYKLLTIIFIGILFLTGCSKTKKAITGDEFYDICDDMDIRISEITSKFDYAESVYQTAEEGYRVTFIEGKTLNDISGLFNDELKNLYSERIADEDVDNLDKKAINGKNFKSFELNYKDNYYYLIYVDKTFLYVQSNQDNKDKVRQIIDTMKY